MSSHSLHSSFSLRVAYSVHFTRGIFKAENVFFKNWWASLSYPPKVAIVLDRGVALAWPQLVADIQSTFTALGYAQIPILQIQGGELCKSDPKIREELLQSFLNQKLCRHSLVLAIGGGALLDTVGYATAIFHRGLRHVRMPTTVLAQNDSGVGVKNGVNAFGKKNILGTFSAPEAVLCDFNFLDSLSPQDRSSGYAEAIKVALLKDADFFEWIQKHSNELKSGQPCELETLIMRCASLHMQHIAQGGDPFEKGSSRPLDFGHWSAHRLEDMSHYQLTHGQAVALGLCCDIHYAKHMGWISKELAADIVQTIERVGLPTTHPLFRQTEQILKGLEDFREHLGGQLTITCLRGVAEVFDVHEIQTEKLLKAFDDMVKD